MTFQPYASFSQELAWGWGGKSVLKIIFLTLLLLENVNTQK